MNLNLTEEEKARVLADRTRRVIRTDGSEEVLEEAQSIDAIERLIGARTLDIVTLRHLRAPMTVMAVDDNSHARQLPPNDKATALYWANCKPGTTHIIRGDVVIAPDGDFGPDL